MFRDGRMTEVACHAKFTRLATLSKCVEANSLDWDDSVVLSEQKALGLGADAR